MIVGRDLGQTVDFASSQFTQVKSMRMMMKIRILKMKTNIMMMIERMMMIMIKRMIS